MSIINFILQNWKVCSVAGLVGLLAGMVELLKLKDRQIGQLRVQLLEQQINSSVQKIDSQVAAALPQVEKAKEDYENALKGDGHVTVHQSTPNS